MELGISGRTATLLRREDRYCKSCRTFRLHLMYEEMEIHFSVCMMCVANYLNNLAWAERAPILDAIVKP